MREDILPLSLHITYAVDSRGDSIITDRSKGNVSTSLKALRVFKMIPDDLSL